MHYDYQIPSDNQIAETKQKKMKTKEFEEQERKVGRQQAERDLDERLKKDLDYMKEKNELGSEKITVAEAGEHSAWFTIFTYARNEYDQCTTNRVDPVNLFFYDVGDANRVSEKLNNAGWYTTDFGGTQCAYASNVRPPGDVVYASQMRPQTRQMAYGDPSYRDHIRIWDGDGNGGGGWEGWWTLGAVHREDAEWEWGYDRGVDHCLVPFHPYGSSFDAAEYDVWNNALGYFPRYFYSYDNDGWYVSCGRSVGNDGVAVWIDMRSNYLASQYNFLYAQQSRYSNDGRFQFTYKNDGNLVLYQAGVGPIWDIRIQNWSPGLAVMQQDGNFVTYSSAGIPYWNTLTWGNPDAYLTVQNDGNVVIYNSYGALWATGTCCR